MAVALKRWCFPPQVARKRATSLACIAVLLGVACSLMQVLGRAMPVVPFLLPIFFTAAAVGGVATTILLLVQARIDASLPLALLAGAYAFTVPLALCSAMALPETIVLRGLNGTGLQTAASA